MSCMRSINKKVCSLFLVGNFIVDLKINFKMYLFSLNFIYHLHLGLEILAFPCNQFAGQEPGSNEEIQETVCTRFKAEFPIFDKVITLNCGCLFHLLLPKYIVTEVYNFLNVFYVTILSV